MGDRGSIQVVSGDEKSVVLFLHWGGNTDDMVGLVSTAYRKVLNGYRTGFSGGKNVPVECYPEELIALLTAIAVEREQYHAYLGRDEHDGDNSDNGHFVLKTNTPLSKEISWILYDRSGYPVWTATNVKRKED